MYTYTYTQLYNILYKFKLCLCSRIRVIARILASPKYNRLLVDTKPTSSCLFRPQTRKTKKWFPRQCCVLPAFLCSKVLSLAHWGRAKHHSFSMLNDSCCSLFGCIWYSWRFQESTVDLCNFIMCIFKPCFRLEFNDETCLNVESSRILEKGTLECRNVGS